MDKQSLPLKAERLAELEEYAQRLFFPSPGCSGFRSASWSYCKPTRAAAEYGSDNTVIEHGCTSCSKDLRLKSTDLSLSCQYCNPVDYT